MSGPPAQSLPSTSPGCHLVRWAASSLAAVHGPAGLNLAGSISSRQHRLSEPKSISSGQPVLSASA